MLQLLDYRLINIGDCANNFILLFTIESGMRLLITSRTLYEFFFFFSSRRRHTRFDCDWSSDVCSSDLSHSGRRRGTLPHATARGPAPAGAQPDGRRLRQPARFRCRYARILFPEPGPDRKSVV